MDILRNLLNWCKEPSTVKGFTILGTLAGFYYSPAQIDVVATAGGAIYALIQMFVVRESKQK